MKAVIVGAACAFAVVVPLTSRAESVPPDEGQRYLPDVGPSGSQLELRKVADWARPGHCGINCLYALLKLKGIDTPYNELASSMHVDAFLGSSLLELKEAAEKSGLKTEVREIDPAGIGQLEPPFVVHLDMLDRGGVGHYLTVYGAVYEPQRGDILLLMIDGDKGLLLRQFLKDLRPALSGFILIPADNWGSGSDVSASSGLLIAVIGLVVVPICSGAFLFAYRHARAMGFEQSRSPLPSRRGSAV